MTTVNALNSNPAATTQAATGKNAAMGKDQFLKLFVAQLQHQDPMNPMQDSDFMGQMASFSTLEQVSNMAGENAKIAQSLTTTGAVGLLGRTVTWVGRGRRDPHRHGREGLDGRRQAFPHGRRHRRCRPGLRSPRSPRQATRKEPMHS